MAQNNGKIIEWHDNPQGFIYEGFLNAEYKQIRLSQKLVNNGIDAPKRIHGVIEKAYPATNVGAIDWTDHQKEFISWDGVNRYAGVGSRLELYRNGKVLSLANVRNTDNTGFAGIAGTIAGAAFKIVSTGLEKHPVFLVFTCTNGTGDLKYYFIQNNQLISSGNLGYYPNYLQAVVVSPDCTKASFIAVPADATQPAYDRVIVDLAIQFSSTYAVSISSSNYQRKDDTGLVIDSVSGNLLDNQGNPQPITLHGIYKESYSYSTTFHISESKTYAVDYDANNIRQEFTVTSYYSGSESQIYTGAGNFDADSGEICPLFVDNQSTGPLSATLTQTKTYIKNYAIGGIFAENLTLNQESTTTWSGEYLKICDSGFNGGSESGYGGWKYFLRNVTSDSSGSSTGSLDKTKELHITGLDLRYGVCVYVEKTPTTTAKKIELPAYLETVYSFSATNTLSLGVWNFDVATIFPLNNFGDPIPDTILTDKHNNKMIQTKNDADVNYILKIDSNNTRYDSTTIKLLKGVI